MTGFLECIAKQIYSESGNDLRNHCLVFPNRRAGLYFLKYLSAEITKPVWTPSIITINELFRSFSKLQLAESEILLVELFKVYRKLKNMPESFDKFFFWGDTLINDFDDIDKYLVNASSLLTNVKDIKKIDELFGSLTAEQVEIIKRFWINFDSEKQTKEKTGFISMWEILIQLYDNFRKALSDKDLAYEGMIFRDVIENYRMDEPLKWRTIHFIGFNALNECERSLMINLKKQGKARFYWDYDNSYIKPGKLNSAGFFMKDNLKLFGNDLPADFSFDNLLSDRSHRRVIDASSDVAQVKLLPVLLKELSDLKPENAHHTAVILSDENLLMPVLTSIPEETGSVNITMGYPLKQTDVYSLIKDIIDLQRNTSTRNEVLFFSFRNVSMLLKNSIISGLLDENDKKTAEAILRSNALWVSSELFAGSALFKLIFAKPSTPALLSDYIRNILSLGALKVDVNDEDSENAITRRNLRSEFIYRIILSLNRLEILSKNTEIALTTETWITIFDKLLRMQSVPFSGEPLMGIQIMGILETRALDFENLIILSVNEGILPSVSAGSSFIPFSLREAFLLPSINYQESIYAYHFYRLLQRARNVTFVYNSNPDGLRSGEMSRFLLQMKYDPQLKPDFIDLNFQIKTHSSLKDTLERTNDHSAELTRKYLEGNDTRILSPSAVNTWLSCRMKFYYRYINSLTEPEKFSGDIDPSILGNLLHNIMNNLYHSFVGSEISGEFIQGILNDKKSTDALIDKAFCEIFNRSNNSYINGNEIIVRDVLTRYFLRILNADKEYAPFKILSIEENLSSEFMVGDRMLKVGGKVDRIDRKNGCVRIVDYKTGLVAETIKSVESLFIEDRKKEADAWLQTLLYCETFVAHNQQDNIYPVIYSVRKSSQEKLTTYLRIKDGNQQDQIIDNYNAVKEEFIAGMHSVINRIFSDQEPFSMTGDSWSKCGNCPYHMLCLR